MKKRWKRNENGSTLVELMTAFLILLLVAEAMLLSVFGYSKTVKRYREIYEAGNRLERHMGDAEYGEPAEIHLAVDGEEFLESGYFAEETSDTGTVQVSGFWVSMTSDRRGFTLVEVMIVMLLFSMLLLMIFPMRRMAVWVLDHARTQEQAEMLGDAAWRYVADRLETGAVEV